MSAQRYSKEFRLRAARLVVEQGYTYNDAARRLGASNWSIRDWVRKYRQSGELPGEPLDKAEELRDLRREIERLTEENDILKKAAAYFAKNSL